ncbi:MAG: T9SS type A sorting domain-containing protein [Flavobacteriales bacterium]
MIGDKYYSAGQSFGSSLNNNPNAAAYGCFHNTRAQAYLTYFHDVPAIDPTVSLSFEAPLLTATANAPEATFQWYLDGVLLEDETESSINPDADGVYEVEVTLFGCTANDQYQYCFVAGTDEVDACNSYTWIDGNTYMEDVDNVTYSLVSSTGCDSLVTLNLHIHQVDLGVSVSGNDISSNYAGASSYQWYECGEKFAFIDGADEQTYTVEGSGEYAVQITTDFCELMSDCGEVIFIGLEENEGWNISLYPNPASDFIVVDKLQGKNEIRILDTSGRLIQGMIATNSTQYISLEDLSAGIYFIQIDSGTTLHTLKFVVEKF